jgi:hypothetical protein
MTVYFRVSDFWWPFRQADKMILTILLDGTVPSCGYPCIKPYSCRHLRRRWIRGLSNAYRVTCPLFARRIILPILVCNVDVPDLVSPKRSQSHMLYQLGNIYTYITCWTDPTANNSCSCDLGWSCAGFAAAQSELLSLSTSLIHPRASIHVPVFDITYNMCLLS